MAVAHLLDSTPHQAPEVQLFSRRLRRKGLTLRRRRAPRRGFRLRTRLTRPAYLAPRCRSSGPSHGARLAHPYVTRIHPETRVSSRRASHGQFCERIATLSQEKRAARTAPQAEHVRRRRFVVRRSQRGTRRSPSRAAPLVPRPARPRHRHLHISARCASWRLNWSRWHRPSTDRRRHEALRTFRWSTATRAGIMPPRFSATMRQHSALPSEEREVGDRLPPRGAAAVRSSRGPLLRTSLRGGSACKRHHSPTMPTLTTLVDASVVRERPLSKPHHGQSSPLPELVISRGSGIGSAICCKASHWSSTRYVIPQPPTPRLSGFADDRPRPSADFRGAHPSPLWPSLRRSSDLGGRGSDALHTLLAAFQSLLYLSSGQEDIWRAPVTTAAVWRLRVLGFSSTRSCSAELAGDPTFRSYSARARVRRGLLPS